MKPTIRRLLSFLVFVSLSSHPDNSLALLSDNKGGHWDLIGKLKTEATFRTTDTPDNNPLPIKTGDMVTQRNLLFIEFQHDLGNIRPWLEVHYFLQSRIFYDSAWDLGPDVLKYTPTRRYYLYDNREEINDNKWGADLFRAYLDITSGPVFLRLGRQILSWGEMSTLSILDNINPTDNSSLSVDLLERRVPLFMVRTTLSHNNFGPFSEASMEGYYVPGAVDNKNGEKIINGSPMIPPVGRYTTADLEDMSDPLNLGKLQQIVEQVDDDFDGDRYGVKLSGMLGELELNVAYYRTYSDIPVPYIDMEAFRPIYLTWGDLIGIDLGNPIKSVLKGQKLQVLLAIDKVDVYGGSFNYYWRWIETVIRGELALFKNVPKMTSGSVRDMIEGMGSQVYLPPPLNAVAVGDLLSMVPLGDLEKQVLPFSSGHISRYDVWKYGIGFDKFMTVPFLNREEFVFLLEYVGAKIVGYEKDKIVKAWQEPNGGPVYETEFSNTFIFIATTNYFNGNLAPRLVTMFELESKALSLLPSVKYEWRATEFEISYFHTFSDNYRGNLGMLESRNEISFRFTLNF